MIQEQEIFSMKRKEIKRLHLIEKVIKKELKQKEAAKILELSTRQVRRMIRRVEKLGERGIMHGLRGRRSLRRLSDKFQEQILSLYVKRYAGFRPTLAVEKFCEGHKIKLSKETLRKWLIDKGLWHTKRVRKRHLQWRERKAYYGEMIQMDGSHHDWLEGRGPWLVLMAQIDDATNEVTARFYEEEGTIPALDLLKRYIEVHGVPTSVYLDRHTTYKSNGKPTIEDELAGRKAMSKFEKACQRLDIKVIHAYSPQAKGRVERLFRTLQDRLVKELRLAQAKTLQEANVVLNDFIKKFNPRFTVASKERTNLHRFLSKTVRLNEVFAVETLRFLRNDNTIVHNKQWYQVVTPVNVKEVLVKDCLDGQTLILAKGRKLKFKSINQPERIIAKSKRTCKPRKRYTPLSSHPWNVDKLRAAKLKQNRTFSFC